MKCACPPDQSYQIGQASECHYSVVQHDVENRRTSALDRFLRAGALPDVTALSLETLPTLTARAHRCTLASINPARFPAGCPLLEPSEGRRFEPALDIEELSAPQAVAQGVT